MKQSQNSASSEIISPGADGLPAVQFWACVLESFIGRTAKGKSLSKDDMTKKDHRDAHTRLIPARTRPHLHTTFICTLSKTIARSTTKAVASINCVCFHRKHRFPSRSLSNTTALKSSIPSNVVPTFPHNRWPQTSSTIVSKLATARWSFRSGPLGIKKRKNKRVGPNIGWPYPWHLYIVEILLQHSSDNTKNKKLGTY